jgi:hypothetical protein
MFGILYYMKRTQEQRQAEVLPILKKLTEMGVKASEHVEVREFVAELQRYIQTGERIEINIPFPAADVDIIGVLETEVNKRVWVKFTRQ